MEFGILLHLLVVVFGLREIQRFTEWYASRPDQWYARWSARRLAAITYRFVGAFGTVLVGLGILVPTIGHIGWGCIAAAMASGICIPCSFSAFNRVAFLHYGRNVMFLATSLLCTAKALGILPSDW